MKKLIVFVLIAACVLLLWGCEDKNDNSEYLRIHIRANSNEEEHQKVKYAVKEQVVKYLTPLLAECGNKEKAYSSVKGSMEEIKAVCSKTLSDNGFEYGCNVYLSKEYFPLRSYNGFTFEGGEYDSLIIELGEGKGDNWWCMVYPPLCFTGGENDGSGRITYKSKILEIIENFKKQYLS